MSVMKRTKTDAWQTEQSRAGQGRAINNIITQPSIYGVTVYFLLCHESLKYSTGQ